MSEHAGSTLNYVLRKERQDAAETVPTMTFEQAKASKRIIKGDTSRDVTRVLFISQNTELLNPTQQSLDGYIDLSDLFDEVHIVIMRQGIPPRNPVLRVAPNVYLYTVAARFWWWAPVAALRLIEEQLVFATGFRPDLIVARDPFESAVVAYRAGRKYGRTTQLHITEDYTTADFVKASRQNFWRRFLPRFTIPKFESVRTVSNTVLKMLQKRYVIPDIEMLPRFQNYESLIDAKATIDLKEKYQPAIFSILYVGKLDHESTLYRAIDAARFVLKNPRVIFVVIGDGKARKEFEKRARILGVEKQVAVESKVKDPTPYLKSADILLVTDTDQDSEELVLQGAAAGIPMVMAYTESRADTFVDGKHAFLVDPADVQGFTDRIDDLMNSIPLRKQFVEQGQELIRRDFHCDPREYQIAYRSSIEAALFVEPDEATEFSRDVTGT